MEQIAILDVLRRHLSMIIALCAVATVAGYALTFVLAEQFEASALVLVRPQQAIKIDTNKATKEFMDFPMSQPTSVETPSKTYIEIIKSAELIGKVVRALSLDKKKAAEGGGTSKPTYLQAAAEDLQKSLRDLIAILKYGRVIADDPFAKAVKGVGSNLSLKATDDTYLFEIKYKAKEPQLAADVANTAAKSFIDFMDEIRRSETQYIRDQLRIQLEQSQQQLKAARQRLEDYKKAHSIFLYETEYNSKLRVIADLEVELAKAEASLVSSQNTLSTVSLAARRARLIRLVEERKAELAPLPRLEHELKQLDGDVKAAATTNEIVDKELREADIKLSYATPEVRLVSQAVPPQLPSSPRRGTITAASLLAGLIAAIGLAFLLEFVNRGVRGIYDIEGFVGVRVLATIPRISKRRWHLAGL